MTHLLADITEMPLHPAIVHFPIALLITAALAAVIYLFNRTAFLKQMIFWLLIIGVIFGAAAVLSGLYEEDKIVHNEAIHEIIETHEKIGFAIAGLFVLLLIWFWVRKNVMSTGELSIWVLGALAGVGLLLYQGYLGGEMVFGEGAGVEPYEQYIEPLDGHHH